MSSFADLAADLFPLRTAAFSSIRYAERAGAVIELFRPDAATPPPLAVLFHGGGWTRGSAAKNVVLSAPLMRAGWAVANVSYRLARESPAPAAAEDAVAALSCCFAVAADHDIDATRIVPFGISAGGHLALCAALAPDLFGATRARGAVAAIVDLYGVADPIALLDGPHAQPFARSWFGAGPEAVARAHRLSPLALATDAAVLPPLFVAHGRDDRIVPVSQSVALHDIWKASGGDVDLLLVDGDHGHFALPDRRAIFAGVEAFLVTRGIWPH